MTGLMLAALQGLGEYGALTGGTSGSTAIGSKVGQITMWASDHRTALIVGVVAGVALLWWFTNPRT